MTLDGQRVLLGSRHFMALSDVPIPADIQQLAERQQAAGHTLVYLTAVETLSCYVRPAMYLSSNTGFTSPCSVSAIRLE